VLVGHLGVAHCIDKSLRRLLLQRDGTPCLGTGLGGATRLILELHGLCVELDLLLLEQELQLHGDLVPQVEQAIARVMGMQTQFGAVRGYRALGAHHEGSGTSVAELEFALGAGEMHATAPVKLRNITKYIK